jgi:hypothetical protein
MAFVPGALPLGGHYLARFGHGNPLKGKKRGRDGKGRKGERKRAIEEAHPRVWWSLGREGGEEARIDIYIIYILSR